MDYYNNQTYYDVLGVEEDASFENIEKAKNRLKFGDSDDRVPFSLWGKIDEAYSVLSNPEQRKEYDKKIKNYDKNIEEYEDIYSDSSHTTDSFSSKSQDDVKEDLQNGIDETKNNDDEILEDEKNDTQQSTQEEKNYDLNYVSEFTPLEKKQSGKFEEKFKTVSKYVGGTVAGFMVAGPLGAVAVPIWIKKHRKIKLEKGRNPKKITKISTAEMSEIERYNQKLDDEINRLLSEPHNNYKLEINKLKYENQIALLEKLLEIKLNKKVKGLELLKFKLDIVATKMQLETAKKNLVNVKEKIDKYEKEQKLSTINKNLIKVNQQLAEQKEEQSFKMKKLESYQSRLLNKRNSKATNLKIRVIRSGKVYDSLLKAKDFAVSLPYIVKSSDKIDEFLQEEKQKTH